MQPVIFRSLLAVLLTGACCARPGRADEVVSLEGTSPLTGEADFPALMRAGIERFAARETERSIQERAKPWRRDLSSREAYEKSVAPNRERFRRIIGAVDPRLPMHEMQYLGGTVTPATAARTEAYTVYHVRWPVLEGVDGEGLLFQPAGAPKARIVAIPDADQTPEAIAGLSERGAGDRIQFARRLAEAGCQVIVPTLIDRGDEWSGHPEVWFTNCTHREWVYRPAFELGRHVIGYEVQKVLAAVDRFTGESQTARVPIGVVGYSEGGLLAMYAAALDTRIDAALVSGYFDARQSVADEPIYRNVWGLLAEFGDAEIASLIAPRPLLVEHAESPAVAGPPAAREGRKPYAAPGAIRTPELASVRAEVERLRAMFPPSADGAVKPDVTVVTAPGGMATTGPGSDRALTAFLGRLGVDARLREEALAPGQWVMANAGKRQRRQVSQLVDHTQRLLDRSERARAAFWQDADATSPQTWRASTQRHRDYLWDEVIGRFPKATELMNPRTRRIIDDPKWTAYEVTLDVWPDVFCHGILLVPKTIPAGERRPVVVCQHGLEGEPMDVVTRDPNVPGFKYYKAFAAQLAERGFVTYAPHNPYRGGNEFRQLQRKLYPLKKTLFSVVLAQHERHLEWLATLPFVDARRVGFYGLSYGGFSAVRLPTLLDGYALSISSAEFTDMARKAAGTRDHYSYPFYNTYEVFEFDKANTFGYADMAALMIPRPFMVERGHDDGVSPDEWVAYEYAKVRRRYDGLGIGNRTAIEFFNGGHEIHGVGTFEFLHRHLDWPEKDGS